MATKPSTLQAIHEYRNRVREAMGKDPLDRTPVSNTLCELCFRRIPHCIRDAGCCRVSPTGPSETCLTVSAGTTMRPKDRPCKDYRAACHGRVCDCLFDGHTEWLCQNCQTMVPIVDIRFVREIRGKGLVEFSSRWDARKQVPNTAMCTGCLAFLRDERRARKGGRTGAWLALRNLMSGVVLLSPAAKRIKRAARMRSHRDALRAKDLEGYNAAHAAYMRAYRARRKAQGASDAVPPTDPA